MEDSHLEGASLNFSNGLTITGDTVFVDLNYHEISHLEVQLKYSIFKLNGVMAATKNVEIETGLYNEILSYKDEVANIYINQPQGFVCLSSPFINSIDESKCQSIYDPLQSSNNSQNCELEIFVCVNKRACNSVGATSQSNITLKDGPVQIRHRDRLADIYQSLYSFRAAITFSDASKKALNSSAITFEKDTINDRIQLLQTIGVTYQKAWLYTNKLAYLQAYYWTLVWGSAGLLRPKIDTSKIVLVDFVCPARPNSIIIDSEINDFFLEYYGNVAFTKVAWIRGYNEFYEVKKNDFGEVRQSKIDITQNQLIIVAIALAGMIGIVGASFVVQLTVMAVKAAKLHYERFLLNQKQLAITKRQSNLSQEQIAVDMQTLLLEFEGQKMVYESRGLFFNSFEIDPIKITEEKIKFSFSLFQIPALLLDYYLRSVLNSLNSFLLSIKENRLQFPAKKFNEYNKTDISIPLYEFQQIYSDYCSSNGYVEIQDIEQTQEEVLKKFDLTIESPEGSTVPAYVNIRFKSIKEKQELQISELNHKNSIDFFLSAECIYTSFENQYISFEQLDAVYIDFCKKNGILESKREQIIGSEQLVQFGAVIGMKEPPLRIIGIKKVDSDKQIFGNAAKRESGLIRKAASLKGKCLANLVSINGLFPNSGLGILHFIMISIVPIITPIVTFCALCEMTTLNANVYARPVTIFDFYTTNRLDPWWDNTPFITIVAYIHIYVLVYLFFAYIELLSFYNTGLDNNGKFPVQFTWIKQFFKVSFYIALGVFLFLYVAMLFFALVWAVLAAILNPSVFLAYSAAALTLSATVSVKYISFKNKLTNFQKSLETLVKEKLGAAFQKSIEKIKQSLDSQLKSKTGIMQTTLAQQAVSSLQTSLDKIGSGFDEEGNQITIVDNLIRVIQNKMDGLSPTIIELMIALQAKNKDQIFQALSQLATELKMDGDLLECITQISLCEFNPDDFQKQGSFGQAEFAIKKLLRKIAPDMPVLDKLGDVCKIVFEKDPEPIIKYIEKYYKGQAKVELISIFLRIVSYSLTNQKDQLKNELLKLLQSLILDSNPEKEKIFQLFEMFDNLRGGDISKILDQTSKLDENMSESAKLLGFKSPYDILFLVDMYNKSAKLSTSILTNSINVLLCEGEMMPKTDRIISANNYNTSNEDLNEIQKIFLSLMSLSRGSSIDLKSIAQQINQTNVNSPPINDDNLEILFSVYEKSSEGYEQMLYKLGCAQQKGLMMDLFSILCLNNRKLHNICARYKVPSAMKTTYTNLIQLLYNLIKYGVMNKEDANKRSKQIDIIYEALSQIKNEKQESFSITNYCLSESSYLPFQYWTQQNNFLVEDINESLDNFQEEIDNDDKNTFRKKLSENDSNFTNVFSSVIKFIENSGLTDQAMAFVRCAAVILVRAQELFDQEHQDYIKCIRLVAQDFEIQTEKLEIIIDTIVGNPLDVFKVTNKSTIQFNMKNEEDDQIYFSPLRMAVLYQLLGGSRQTLTQVCLRWYQQYAYFQKTKNTLDILLKNELGPVQELAYILNIFRNQQSENIETKDILTKEIKRNLMKKIISIKRNGIENVERGENEYPISDKFFSPTSSLYPIQQAEIYNQEQTLDSSDIFETLIKFKSFDLTTLSKLIDEPKSDCLNVKTFKTFLQACSNRDYPHQILNLQANLAQIIPMLENTNLQYIPTPAEQTEQIGLSLLLNASGFTKICEGDEIDNYQMTKSLTNILTIEGQNKYAMPDEKDYPNCLVQLFENGFLNSACINMMKPLEIYLKQGITQKKSFALVGLLLGYLKNERQLIRHSLLELYSDTPYQFDLAVAEGFIAVLLRDIEPQHSITKLCQQLDIDGAILVNLMDLSSNDTKNLQIINIEFFKNIKSIQEKRLCQGLVSLIKGDFSQVKQVIQKLKIKENLALPIIAAALGNFQVMSEFYSSIQDGLQLNSQSSVRYLIQLSHGKTKCIKELSSQKAKGFYIDNPKLFEAIFVITHTGKQIYEGIITKLTSQMLSTLDSKIFQIFERLADVFDQKNLSNEFQIQTKILTKASWGDHLALSQIRKRLIENVTDQESIWYSKGPESSKIDNFNENDQIKYIKTCFDAVMKQNIEAQQTFEITLNGFMRMIIYHAVPIIYNQFHSKNKIISMQDEKIDIAIQNAENDAMNKLLKTEVKIIPKKVSGLNTKHIETKKPNSELDEYADKIAQINCIGNEKYNEISLSIKNKFKKEAYKIGCTFGIGLYKKIKQPLFICRTCDNNSGQDENSRFVCQICSMFCHSQHDLQPVSEESFIHGHCSCGSGDYCWNDTLNSNNPIKDTKEKKYCTVLHNTYGNIQEKCSNLLQQDYLIFQNSTFTELQSYGTQQFLADLQQCSNYPQFFNLNNNNAAVMLVDNQILKKNNKGIMCLIDYGLNTYKSLIENMILFANGRITDSMAGLFRLNQKFDCSDFYSLDIFSQSYEKDLTVYKTLQSFIAIAQNDIDKFQIYGKGFANVLNEVGTREQPAVQKLSNIILLAKGGQLPVFEPQLLKHSTNEGPYAEIFKKMFGIRWKPMIALHKMLTLSHHDLIYDLGIGEQNELLSAKSNVKTNNQSWLDDLLLNTTLKLNKKSIETFKNVVGIICKNASSIDFFAQEYQIKSQKAQLYKTLVFSSDINDYTGIFDSLDKSVYTYNAEILFKTIIQENSEDYIAFIKGYFMELMNIQGQCENMNIFYWDSSKYLQAIVEIMSGESQNLEENFKIILNAYINKTLLPVRGASSEHVNRLVHSFETVYGVCNEFIHTACQIVDVFKKDSQYKEIAQSAYRIINDEFQTEDIKKILCTISESYSKTVEGSTEILTDCRHLINALNGNIVSWSLIMDKLSNNDSFTRQFVCSLITSEMGYNNLKYQSEDNEIKDNIIDVEQLTKHRYLREIFRIFEKAVRIQFKVTDEASKTQVENFIKMAFDDQFPLKMIILLTEDRKMTNMLCNCQETFKSSVTINKPEYLRMFMSFLNPFNTEAQTKPLYSALFNDQKQLMISIQIFENPFASKEEQKEVELDLYGKPVVKAVEFQIEILDFLNFNFNIMNTDDTIFAIQSLYKKYMHKCFENIIQVKSIIEMQLHGMVEGGDANLFKELPQFINIMMKTIKIQSNEVDKTVAFVCQWLESINIMMKKDQITIAEMKKQLLLSLQATFDYFEGKPNHPFTERKDNILFVADVVFGVISLTKGDFTGLKPLAKKLGGFPKDIDKIQQLVEIIQQNKEGLSFKTVKEVAMKNIGTIVEALPLPGGEKMSLIAAEAIQKLMDDPTNVFDPRLIFKIFANNRGTIGIEEFENMLIQFKIKIPRARILQLFSFADKEKKGELTYRNFVQLLEQLKLFIVQEIMGTLGVSVKDMAVAFIFSITLLLLMFSFIFVGIGAFSPVSSFSSVTNSLLTLGAGGAVNKKSEDDNKKPEELAQDVQDAPI